MISIRRNSHQMNGASVDVLEVWHRDHPDREFNMILTIPLDPNEEVEADLEADLTDTPYLRMSDREKAELHREPDVMTPDGRKKVAEKMLDDLVRYHNAKASAFSQAKQDEYGHIEDKLRTEILELMGVDS